MKEEVEAAQKRLEQRRNEVAAEPVDLGSASERLLERLGRVIKKRLEPDRRREGFRERDLDKIRAHQPEVLTSAQRRERLHQWLTRCHVPPAYLGCTKQAWKTTWCGRPSPWHRQLDFWMGDPWCLVLRGRPGTGKTHRAVAMMVELARKRPPWLRRNRSGIPAWVDFVSVPQAIREIREDYQSGDRAPGRRTVAGDLSKRMKEFDLVVLDDVGAQPDRENWRSEVSGWIYDRHAQGRATIVTLNPEDQNGLEDRAARRLNDGVLITID